MKTIKKQSEQSKAKQQKQKHLCFVQEKINRAIIHSFVELFCLYGSFSVSFPVALSFLVHLSFLRLDEFLLLETFLLGLLLPLPLRFRCCQLNSILCLCVDVHPSLGHTFLSSSSPSGSGCCFFLRDFDTGTSWFFRYFAGAREIGVRKEGAEHED